MNGTVSIKCHLNSYKYENKKPGIKEREIPPPAGRKAAAQASPLLAIRNRRKGKHAHTHTHKHILTVPVARGALLDVKEDADLCPDRLQWSYYAVSQSMEM